MCKQSLLKVLRLERPPRCGSWAGRAGALPRPTAGESQLLQFVPVSSTS